MAFHVLHVVFEKSKTRLHTSSYAVISVRINAHVELFACLLERIHQLHGVLDVYVIVETAMDNQELSFQFVGVFKAGSVINIEVLLGQQ